jgi:hypothetical protein
MIVAPRRRSRRPNKALIGVAKVLGVHGSQDGVRYGDIVIEGVQRRYVFDRFSGAAQIWIMGVADRTSARRDRNKDREELARAALIEKIGLIGDAA